MLIDSPLEGKHHDRRTHPDIRASQGISFVVYSGMRWTVETLNETVDAEVEALPEDMRARLARIATLNEDKGLERVGELHVKHVEGRLWEGCG